MVGITAEESAVTPKQSKLYMILAKFTGELPGELPLYMTWPRAGHGRVLPAWAVGIAVKVSGDNIVRKYGE